MFDANNIFFDALRGMKSNENVKAYVTNTLVQRMLSTQSVQPSITLWFIDARNTCDFKSFQGLGDWVLWRGAVLPDAHEPHSELDETLARLSYDACYRMLYKKLTIYEELANDLHTIIQDARNSLQDNLRTCNDKLQERVAKSVFVR